jgi:hypothetical protein
MWIRNPAMNATQYLSPVSDPTDRMKISFFRQAEEHPRVVDHGLHSREDRRRSTGETGLVQVLRLHHG